MRAEPRPRGTQEDMPSPIDDGDAVSHLRAIAYDRRTAEDARLTPRRAVGALTGEAEERLREAVGEQRSGAA